MIHYFNIVGKILTTSYPFSRLWIFLNYTKLYLKSVVHYKFLKQNTDLYTIDLFNCTISFSNYGELLSLIEEIFVYQTYRFTTSAEYPCIIDCGSHIGISVLYFKTLYPKSTIIAFEPDQENLRLLKENIDRNHLRKVKIYPFALSNVEGNVTLIRTEKSSVNTTVQADSDEAGIVHAKARKLSGFIDREVNLVKMDVEGSEEKIIDDLINEKAIDNIQQIILEHHPLISNTGSESVVKTLEDQGFECHIPSVNQRSGLSEIMIYCQRKNP